MTALRDFQSRFGAFLTGSDAESAATFFLAATAANAGIHRNNVRHAHRGALAQIFPAVRALVGEAYFDAVAGRFADTRPPRGAVLADYGSGFDDFLAGRTELSQLPFLPDVAQLEWAVNMAFHAHSVPSLSPGAAASVLTTAGAAPSLRLMPGARLVEARAPAREIRDAALAGDAGRLESLDFERPQRLLVVRARGEVVIEALSEGEAGFLGALQTGAPLEPAILSGIESDPEFFPAEAIGRLLHLGAFRAPSPQSKGPDS